MYLLPQDHFLVSFGENDPILGLACDFIFLAGLKAHDEVLDGFFHPWPF